MDKAAAEPWRAERRPLRDREGQKSGQPDRDRDTKTNDRQGHPRGAPNDRRTSKRAASQETRLPPSGGLGVHHRREPLHHQATARGENQRIRYASGQDERGHQSDVCSTDQREVTADGKSRRKRRDREPAPVMAAIRSTGTPASASKNGSGVALKSTMIPRGRISKLNSQGAGHACELCVACRAGAAGRSESLQVISGPIVGEHAAVTKVLNLSRLVEAAQPLTDLTRNAVPGLLVRPPPHNLAPCLNLPPVVIELDLGHEDRRQRVPLPHPMTKLRSNLTGHPARESGRLDRIRYDARKPVSVF